MCFLSILPPFGARWFQESSSAQCKGSNDWRPTHKDRSPLTSYGSIPALFTVYCTLTPKKPAQTHAHEHSTRDPLAFPPPPTTPSHTHRTTQTNPTHERTLTTMDLSILSETTTPTKKLRGGLGASNRPSPPSSSAAASAASVSCCAALLSLLVDSPRDGGSSCWCCGMCWCWARRKGWCVRVYEARTLRLRLVL